MTMPYESARALTTALSAAAKKRAALSGDDSSTLVTQNHFDRFLCRIFSDPDADFALKGGTGLLARISTTRSTQDVDLEARASTLEFAIHDLVRLSAIDLDDHFTFTPAGKPRPAGGGHR